MLINSRYRVLGILGGGSHASVFHVLDLRHDERPVALKLLRRDRPSELLQWEFGQLRRLLHPNLARVYDLDTVDRVEEDREGIAPEGALFLTQDLVPGEPADRAVESKRSSSRELVRWVLGVTASVCRALSYLHARGIVHRDVKPANVIVGDDPHAACLIDLSLSTGGILGRSEDVAGSLAFMAPEAMAGAAEPRSDLFSVGVMLHFLLSRRFPFGELRSDTASMVRAILNGRPRALSEDAPGIVEGLEEILLGLLEPEPMARPASARDVLVELGRRFGPDAVGLDEGLTGTVDAQSEVDRESYDWAAVARVGGLVGRERELELIATLLDERLDTYGRGSPVLAVVGPAGAGKSALVREADHKLLLRAAAEGAPAPLVLHGTIRTVSQTLRKECGRALVLPRLASWLGESSAGDSSGMRGGEDEGDAPDATALCEELALLIEEASTTRPVVVHLESGHGGLAEDFVAYLHRRSEVEALTSERRAPFSLILEKRVESGQQVSLPLGVAVVEVRPLADTEIRQVITDRIGQGVSEAVLEAAVSAARGRPLLLFAFLSQAAEQGPLGKIDEKALATLWGERDGLESDAAEVLSGAVGALPEAQRSALLALALWGQPAGSRELAGLLELTIDDAIECLGELRRKGFVELGNDGEIRPVAPDLAFIAHRLMGDEWAFAVHQRAYDLSKKAVISTRARLARAAMVPEAAVLSVEAAEELLESGDPASATTHIEEALELDLGEMWDRASRVYRRALRASGNYSRAVELWSEAVERGEAGARVKLSQMLRLAGRTQDARVIAREALEIESSESTWGARAVLARLDLDMGRARDALEVIGTSAPGVADGPGADAFEEAAGLARLALGNVDLARAHFRACLLRAHKKEDSHLLSRAHNLMGMAAHHREKWSEAGGHYAKAESLARDAGHAHAAASYGVNVAVARLEAGELGEALSPLRRAMSTLAGIGRTWELAGALYNYASLLVVLGDSESGLRVHERAVAAARRAGARHVEAYCSLLLGDLHRRRGSGADLEIARDAYESAAESFHVLEAPREVCWAQLLLAETLVSLSLRTEASIELERTVEYITSAGDDVLSARFALTTSRLALAGVGDLEKATTKLLEAMKPIRALEQLDLRWRGELLLARLMARLGDREGALLAVDATVQLLGALEEHVPEHYRSLWRADPERVHLERLEISLGSIDEFAGKGGDSVREGAEDAAPLRRLLAINKRLNSELRLGRLLDEIIDTIVDLTDAERGFLLLKNTNDTLTPRSARNMDRRAVASDDMRLSRSIAEQVVATGEPVVTVDAQADGRFDTASSVHALRLRSILVVPLRVKGDVVGAVYVDDRVRPGAFGEGALDLVLSVADQAAIAIENARLLSENRKRQRKIEGLNRALQAELDKQRVELEELRRELDGQRTELATKYSYDAIVARSAAMTKLFRILDRVTDSEVPVVIQGESGTGKELCARAIHYNGPRKEHPFVTENCGAIPETLLESVLFGHVKGAFTGADRNRQGLFAAASGGTLLLDEISEMSPAMQAKLLRVLQEGELRPVGGNETVQVDVRVITSSNRDLGKMVRKQEFREDLYYRLNVITVRLPPLRERPEDVPLLVEHFIEKHGGGRVVGVDRTALKRLTGYNWPGNVRQLENEVMRSVVLADDIIREEHLTPEIADEMDSGMVTLDDLDLKGQVAHLETRLIRRALERFKGNQSRAAAALGLSRYGLQKKMARFGVTAKG